MRQKLILSLLVTAFVFPLMAKARAKSDGMPGSAPGALPDDKGPVVLLLDAPHLKKAKFSELSRREDPLVELPDDGTLPRHFRSSADTKWHHGYNGPAPSTKGLLSLQCSGSAEFSVGQWNLMFAKLRSMGAFGLTVVDLRQEAHGLVNNMAVAWYAFHDGIDEGKDVDQVMSEESERLELLHDAGVISVGKLMDKSFSDPADWRTIALRVRVKEVRTEYEIVSESEGTYFRILAPDYMAPPDAVVDRFVGFVRDLDDGEWVHFHCCAGDGRTTTFMTLYDMMRNYDKVSADDIILRQYLLGGIDLNAVLLDKPLIKQKWAKQRAAFIRQFYRYCQSAGPSFSTNWSQWKAQDKLAPAKK